MQQGRGFFLFLSPCCFGRRRRLTRKLGRGGEGVCSPAIRSADAGDIESKVIWRSTKAREAVRLRVQTNNHEAARG